MKKTFILLFIVTVLCSRSFGQPITSFVSLSQHVSNTGIVFGGSILYDKTIGMYPQKAVSCYEGVISGERRGVITIVKDTMSAKSYVLYPQILVRDMVQSGFSDRVCFCGARWDPVLHDSIGVMGYMVIDAAGILQSMNYIDVAEVGVLTDLVRVMSSGREVIVSIGQKEYNSTRQNYVVKGYESSYTNTWEYDVAPLSDKYITDIVSTDDYVAIVSTDLIHNLRLRRFNVMNLDDAMKDVLYEYPLSENIEFSPEATFLGREEVDAGENRIALVHSGLKNDMYWHMFLKVMDLSTMGMTNAQSHHLYEKNYPIDITYLSEKKTVAVLDFFDPDYTAVNPTVVLFKPDELTNYVYYKFNYDDMLYWHSLSKLCETPAGASFYLCGGVYGADKYYHIHNVGSLSYDQCVDSHEIAIDRDERVEYTALPSPLQFTHNLSLLQDALCVERIDLINAFCQYPNE